MVEILNVVHEIKRTCLYKPLTISEIVDYDLDTHKVCYSKK